MIVVNDKLNVVWEEVIIICFTAPNVYLKVQGRAASNSFGEIRNDTNYNKHGYNINRTNAL